MNKYVIFHLSTGYVGQEDTLCYVYDEKMSDEEIDEYGNDLLRDHCEMYGIVDGMDEDGCEADMGCVDFEVVEGTLDEMQETYGEVLTF